MQEEDIQKECLHKLCEAIEAKVERKMQTTRDYDLLAGRIFQELHQQISPTTLKRIWGIFQVMFNPYGTEPDPIS